MPTYEYECDACGHRFEDFQQINDAPLKSCPKCRKRKLRRLIGAGGGGDLQGHRLLPDRLSLEAIQADKSKAETSAAPAACDTKKCESCPKNAGSKSEGIDGRYPFGSRKMPVIACRQCRQASPVPQGLRPAVLSLLQRALQAAGPGRLARRKAPDPGEPPPDKKDED